MGGEWWYSHKRIGQFNIVKCLSQLLLNELVNLKSYKAEGHYALMHNLGIIFSSLHFLLDLKWPSRREATGNFLF